MKISILLPYKENFSPEYPGAVSLFVYETSKISRYKKSITVFGNTNYSKKFDINYINIELKKTLLSSQTRNYVNKFIKLEKEINSSLIEIRFKLVNFFVRFFKCFFITFKLVLIIYSLILILDLK